jgi:hypothetical protein
VVLVAVLSLVALIAGCLSRSGSAPAPLRLAWAFSPASNTVTIQVTPPDGTDGTAGRQLLAQSRLAVSEHGNGHTERWSAAGGTMQVPVPAGDRTSLLVQLTGPQPLTRTLTVSAPRAPRILTSGASSGRWLVWTSDPLRAGPSRALCGTDKVSLVAPQQLAVSESGRVPGSAAAHRTRRRAGGRPDHDPRPVQSQGARRLGGPAVLLREPRRAGHLHHHR